MRVAEERKQQKIRRKASEAVIVYDLHTSLPVGQVLDMSARGMKLMSEEPVTVNQIYYFRMPLDREINGYEEIYLDAQCRWCKLSEETGWYNSGYMLRFRSADDAKMVRDLIHAWMANEIDRINTFHVGGKKKKRGLLSRLLGH